MSCTVLNTRAEQKISLHEVYYFLTKQTTLTVIMSEVFVAQRLSYVLGLKQHLDGHILQMV